MSAVISLGTVRHLLDGIAKFTGISPDVFALHLRAGEWLALDVQDDGYAGTFVGSEVAGYLSGYLSAVTGVVVSVGNEIVSEGATIGLQLIAAEGAVWLKMAVR